METSGLIWPKFKLTQALIVCHQYLQGGKGSNQEQPKKKWQHRFPIRSLWRFFQALKGS